MFEFVSENKSTAAKSSSSSTKSLVQKKADKTGGDSLSELISNSKSLPAIQPKVSIGKSNDKYEKEADSAAEKISAKPKELIQPSVQLKTESEEEPLKKGVSEVEEKEKIKKKSEGDKEEEKIRKKDEGEKEEEKVQKKGEGEKEEEKIQSKDAKTKKVGRSFENKLVAQKGKGEQLPEKVKSFMEPRFKKDFGNVKVHTGSPAAEMNKDLKAQAFTNGSDLFFNEGKFKPNTKKGTELIAHELTHVVQQGKAKPKEAKNINIKAEAENEPVKPAAVEKPAEKSNEESKAEIPTAAAGASENKTASEKISPAKESSEKPLKEKSVQSKEKAEKSVSKSKAAKGKPSAGGGGGKAEKSAPVQSIPMEGKSEEVMESFANAKASQVAASYPALGSSIEGKLKQEQIEAAETTPPLKAETGGMEKLPEAGAEIPEAGTAEIQDGVTEPEPPKPEVEKHENLAPPPDNSKVTDQLNKTEEGGFFSWFRNSFKSVFGGVSTSDQGLNTSAGEKPQMDLNGEANPERAENQRSEGDQEITSSQTELVDSIETNPGKENIQPLQVKEEIQLEINKETKVAIPTAEDQGMKDYTELPFPAEIREAADSKMAPLMEKSLAKQREEVTAAASKRDSEKEEAVSKANEETAKLNEDAEKEQNEIVNKSRSDVETQQQEGKKEAQDKLGEFNKETDTEQTANEKIVDERINNDQTEADKKISDAEVESEKEKEKGETEARQKKEELEKESENDSWWDRAVNAVKSAVKAITAAIDKVFDAVRKAVKFIIDTAKNAALAVIEAGRKWIVDKLDAFGKWLKDKVTKYIGSVFPELAKKINAAIDVTVNAAKDAVNAVAGALKAGIEALAKALNDAINSLLNKFQAAMKAAVQIAGALLTGDFAEALKIAFYAACEIAGIDPKPITDFLNYAGDTIMIIFKDPVAFFMNVVDGVKKGLNQFVDNIKKHLLNGLIGWLTGALSEAAITLPETWDVKGVFSLVMQILGLTYENIRAKVVKKLGPKGEQIISYIEKGVDLVKDLITRGPIALWERVKESLSDIKETVISGIRDWVITTVIKEGVIWLFSLLNPASAIVKALKLLYDVVMFFVERWNQIVDFVKSVFESVGALARGSIDKAANSVESALGKSVPVIISFIASLLGLGGIGKAIKKIIEKIQKPIDKALDKVIDWVIDKGKILYEKGKALYQKGKEKVFGKEDEKEEDESTRERNKKAAAQKVSSVLKQGIKKTDLLTLLDKLQGEHKLKSITLNKDNDVVIINSDPITLKGKPYSSESEKLALKEEKGKLKKDTAGSIVLGNYSSSGLVFPTLKSVISQYIDFDQVGFPISNLPAEAERPDDVNAKLTGALGEGVSKDVERDSAMTTTVGNLGDIESTVRRNAKTPHNIYQGGHIVASRFGGPEVFKNLIPQAQKINVGFYKSMENFIAENLSDVEKSGSSKLPPNGNSAVSMDVNMKYGNTISRNLMPLMIAITNKAFGRQWSQIAKMPKGEKKDKEKEKLGKKAASYYQQVEEEGKADQSVDIVPWIPTKITVKVTFETDVAEGFKGDDQFFSSEKGKGVSGEVIIDESAKVDDKGIPKSSDESSPTVQKKKWSATFTYNQSNKL